MVTRVLTVSILAGLLAGLIVAALQHVTTTPLILKAETYEAALALKAPTLAAFDGEHGRFQPQAVRHRLRAPQGGEIGERRGKRGDVGAFGHRGIIAQMRGSVQPGWFGQCRTIPPAGSGMAGLRRQGPCAT